MKDLDRFTLPRDATTLVVIDIQDRLHASMDPDRKPSFLANSRLLLQLAGTLQLPVLVTEQYPRGLGKTLPEIEGLLPEGSPCLEKVVFSSWRADGFSEQWARTGSKAAILIGMESHVCVLGTALDLLKQGFSVHVPRDAVISRTRENWQTGLDLMYRAGGLITSTETVIFQMLERAGTEEFKAMSTLLK